MRCNARQSQSGFTLAEVLAALLFMAIVIPVAVQGVQVASRAGQVGARKADALRIADRVLNEIIATGKSQSSSPGGVVQEGSRQFQWTMQSTPWTEDEMNQLTVRVQYTVQGRTYDVDVSTLVDPNQNATYTE
jgi:type II secretory pathway pseudopilin PulG